MTRIPGVRLTSDLASEGSAAYSPDGNWIALYAEAAERSDIVVIDAQGGSRRVVTAMPGKHNYPAWSPDGRWLTFFSLGAGDQYDIGADRVDGSDEISLVSTAEDEREWRWALFQKP